MNISKIMLLPLAAIVSIGAAHAQDAAPQEAATLAARFGALETVRSISLSPDGGHIAYVGPTANGTGVAVVDLNAPSSQPRLISSVTQKSETITSCQWLTDARLVCNIYIDFRDSTGQLIGFSRIFAVNSDGSATKLLTAPISFRTTGITQNGGHVIDWNVAGQAGKVLMTRQYVPEVTIGTRLASQEEGEGVDVVDTLSLARTRAEPPMLTASDYISDGNGNVRVMGRIEPDSLGYTGHTEKYYYRKPNTRGWVKFASTELGGAYQQGFEPVAIDAAKNLVYGFDTKDGNRALFSMALDDGNSRQLVLSRPGIDVDELMTLGRAHRVVGASYATERRTAEYFDPELARLSAAFTKALPGNPSINFIGASADEGKLLLVSGGDTNPGMIYLYDKTSHHLDELMPLRSQLDGQPLAPMRAVTYTAADGTAIPAYLTLPVGGSGKNLPALVMPHGGPAARDEWGFDWLVQFFAARGFAVLQPNYRGSSGYGANWYQHNGFQSWQTAIGDVNDAGRWLVKQGIAAPGKLAIFGWSYGGYAALQSAVLDPDLFKAVVAVAPVTDLDRLRAESLNYSNYALTSHFIGEGPHIEAGSPARHAAAFKAPVLLFHGDLDQNVAVDESRLMRAKLSAAGKSVQYVEFPGLDHQLANGEARSRLLATSDAFLRQALGIK